MSVLQIVSADLATVLWDFDDATGNANGGVVTGFGLGQGFNLGSPTLERTLFSGSSSGSVVTYARAQLVESSFRLRASAADYDTLAAGIGELGRLLREGCVMAWTPGATTRYIDVVPSSAPALLAGRNIELLSVLTDFDTPMGVEIVFLRQPYLRGAELDSAANILANPTLLAAFGSDKAPDGWAWASETNITGTAPSSAQEAWTNNIATTSERYCYQMTAAATCAVGEVWTASAYIKASAAGMAQFATGALRHNRASTRR